MVLGMKMRVENWGGTGVGVSVLWSDVYYMSVYMNGPGYEH